MSYPAAFPVPHSLATEQLPYQLTVVICTYNGAQRFPQVLDRLLAQTGSEHIRWQIFVVDNNSRDATAEVVEQYQQQWPRHTPLRYLFEPRQGAAYARQLAVEKAQSELIGFLDDDNLPASNWVASAWAFSQSHPYVGAYGSQIHGEFEGTLPENFERIQSFFALTQRGETAHRYLPRNRVLPPSAGLVVRRKAWLNNVPRQLILTGPHERNRLAGEDLEAMTYIRQSAWEIWHNPAMKVWHQIPARRLQRDYLIPFFQGIGLSRHVTRMRNLPAWQRPLVFWVYLASDFGRACHHLLVYQRESKTNTVSACELQLYISSMISPFYIWTMLLRRRRP